MVIKFVFSHRYTSIFKLHASLYFVSPYMVGTPVQRHEGLDENILDNCKALYEVVRARHPQQWSVSGDNYIDNFPSLS
jgi:hypothetical protein